MVTPQRAFRWKKKETTHREITNDEKGFVGNDCHSQLPAVHHELEGGTG
jgi:hypothetical protein